MGDTWQYRVRVSGPERERWFARAIEHRWGGVDGNPPLYDWPMMWAYRDGKTLPANSTWYNVEVTTMSDYAEFIGNFSGTPRYLFERGKRKDGGFRGTVGPALFSDLKIHVEVIGLSWLCDVPGGVYSYRDVYENAALVSSEKGNDASVAAKYAPELIEKFPQEDDA